ncbi:MAG: MarR family transcriptional regulator [Candidatus Krumholzibacteriia bacterium]
MGHHDASIFECCLYFTANSLAREISRLADRQFGQLGMSTPHAFLLTQVVERPGITQKDLAHELNLAQSTVSRFVDTLVARGFLVKEADGRQVHVHSTPTGRALIPRINEAWGGLYREYCDLLGEEAAERLTRLTLDAHRRLAAKE